MKTQITQWLAKSARPTPPIINSYHRSTTCPRCISRCLLQTEQWRGTMQLLAGNKKLLLWLTPPYTAEPKNFDWKSSIQCFLLGYFQKRVDYNIVNKHAALSLLSGKYWLCHVYDIGPSQLIGPFRQNSENTSNEVTYSMESFLINLNIG